MDLRDELYEASAAPPPTTIDVDRLIAGEHRRARGLRLLGGVAAVAVLAAGAMTLPRYFGESQAPPPVLAASSGVTTTSRAPLPCPTPVATGPVVLGGGQPWHPVTEDCGAAIERLTNAVDALIARELPGLKGHNAGVDKSAPPRFIRDPHMVTAYNYGVEFEPVNGRRSFVSVIIQAGADRPGVAASALPCRQGEKGCSRQVIDGAIVQVHGQSMNGARGYQINVYRQDGTQIVVIGRCPDPGYDPPYTADQLVRIAAAPELTLYP
ncbi:hypothetical protein AB0M46_28445 [Dactylosporangium sp. NPDC051485]|uniref:hypothetical protein n=1 Tax=Dactylosporangium sp. NPDC051485 TaxID=3154846 RepID=UPI00344A83C7